jgi:hypothetical protein
VIGALFLIPITILLVMMAGYRPPDGEAANPLIELMIGGLYLWFDYMIIAKLIWPPEVEISLSGIRFSNRAMFASGSYDWSELDGPVPGNGGSFQYRVPLLIMTAPDRTYRIPPSHFDATYAEMAAVIEAARDGRLIGPARWRSENPQHRVRHWLLDWGLPIALAVGLAIGLAYLRR